MHRCSVHALSGIVGVGGCQCHSACRSTRRVCTRIIQRRQESKLTSYKLPSDVLLVDLYDRHCGRACDGFRNTSDPVQRDFTHLFTESNHLALVHVSCSRTERHFVINCGDRDVRTLTHSYARRPPESSDKMSVCGWAGCQHAVDHLHHPMKCGPLHGSKLVACGNTYWCLFKDTRLP